MPEWLTHLLRDADEHAVVSIEQAVSDAGSEITEHVETFADGEEMFVSFAEAMDESWVLAGQSVEELVAWLAADAPRRLRYVTEYMIEGIEGDDGFGVIP